MKLREANELTMGGTLTVTLSTGEEIKGELLVVVPEPCVIIDRGGYPTAVALSHVARWK